MQFQAKVVIVGAGPVGLTLANLLGARGIDTLVIERSGQPSNPSRAIGVTPPSLYVLEKLGLAEQLVASGVPIRRAVVHGTKRELGQVTFDEIDAGYRFVLSVPQPNLEALLEENLSQYNSVRMLRGAHLTALDPESKIATLRKSGASDLPSRTDSPVPVKFGYLCACDGSKSTVRSVMELPFRGSAYRDTFVMGDFVDRSALGDEAHLFFTRYGSVESFPLPEGYRRWIVQTEQFVENPDDHFLEERVKRRAGIALAASDRVWQSPFGTQGYILESYAYPPVFFAGDAAHVIPPIGGQGMNTGIADADFLAASLAAVDRGRLNPQHVFSAYSTMRRRATRAALRRARASMWVGTRSGPVGSLLRNLFLKGLLRGSSTRWLARTYAMLTIPYATLNGAESGIGFGAKA
jgi:2-polyprenyl-6-methoxyphenol hydroxylase-like FAD-dependent oxidoreductase